jgi:ABC-type transporter Mla subunit MlaD
MSTPSMEQAIEQLRAEVERNSSVDDSAIQLLTTLADTIERIRNSPTELMQLVETMRAQSDALAAAVVANTPSDESENPPA